MEAAQRQDDFQAIRQTREEGRGGCCQVVGREAEAPGGGDGAIAGREGTQQEQTHPHPWLQGQQGTREEAAVRTGHCWQSGQQQTHPAVGLRLIDQRGHHPAIERKTGQKGVLEGAARTGGKEQQEFRPAERLHDGRPSEEEANRA